MLVREHDVRANVWFRVDMKPQNILIFPGGKVKLCDFG